MKNEKKQNGWKKPLRRLHVVGIFMAVLFAATRTVCADDAQEKIFAARAQAAFERAQAQYLLQTNNPVLGWQFARACYDWADWATNKSERAVIAKAGMAACRRVILFTNCAAAHYYMGLNMGQLAQSEAIHGLKLVREMEHEWQTAIELDPRFDSAGPERNLGLLYRDAPGWPLSIGNRHKAQEHLQNAASLAPDDPENILNLAESYLKWGDQPDARDELAALDALWPKAQKNLTGETWERDWYDWSKRRDVVRQKLNAP
jgi:tetratricopeptide (TPR) repeat protein